ncbi:hypothetical protein [Nocardia acidivorans]|uniref:hypothetical protein n=1 Tax=Nocardia acidivorans TaxID=404580 RepID=UPI000AC40C36|nr:hypothetical protein [Nocardia acidivorans]
MDRREKKRRLFDRSDAVEVGADLGTEIVTAAAPGLMRGLFAGIGRLVSAIAHAWT